MKMQWFNFSLKFFSELDLVNSYRNSYIGILIRIPIIIPIRIPIGILLVLAYDFCL